MSLTPAQMATLKADIAANTSTVQVGPDVLQIKDVPNTPDTNGAIADWYNTVASPNYWAWKASVSRADVYHATGPDGTVWDWATYKGQSAPEQNAWTQMFMGDEAPVSRLNFREGVNKIFSGSAAQTAQRTHILAVSRRLASRVEKLLSVAVAAVGSGASTISPTAANGNVLADPLGGTTNPAALTFNAVVQGALTAQDVTDARSS
jgi:hypothetical protein